MEPFAIAGSTDDLSSTFRDHAARVMAIAFGILRDRADAEDVVQDTFASAFRLAPKYDSTRGDTGTWLRCMARSRAIDRLRVRQARERTLALLPDAFPVFAPEEVAGQQERERLHACLEALPRQQREAIELAYFSGFTHQEIADSTSAPLGTVKTRLRLGLQRLAAALADG